MDFNTATVENLCYIKNNKILESSQKHRQKNITAKIADLGAHLCIVVIHLLSLALWNSTDPLSHVVIAQVLVISTTKAEEIADDGQQARQRSSAIRRRQ